MGGLGWAVAVAASSSAPAALSGCPLAWPGLGCGLRWAVRAMCCTLWVSLLDPRAAERQENDDTDKRGQAAGHFLRVGSSPGWSDGVAVLDWAVGTVSAETFCRKKHQLDEKTLSCVFALFLFS